jgi:hypothetical protein
MSFLTRYLLPLLAVLAVATAQVFGLGRGYLCDCGGVEKVTQADHCHSPHSSACHEYEEESCFGGDDHQDGDTHRHPALIESLLASLLSDVHVAAPVPVLVHLTQPGWQVLQATQMPVSQPHQVSDWGGHDPGRTWPHMLAHTLVLRI